MWFCFVNAILFARTANVLSDHSVPLKMAQSSSSWYQRVWKRTNYCASNWTRSQFLCLGAKQSEFKCPDQKLLLLRTISLCRQLKLVKICSFPMFLHEQLSISQPHHYSCACSWLIFCVKFPCRKQPFPLGFISFSLLCAQDKLLVPCWTIKGQSFHLKVQKEMTAILPDSVFLKFIEESKHLGKKLKCSGN